MKEIIFQDLLDTEIKIKLDDNKNIKIIQTYSDGVVESSVCLLLSKNQANILINAIQDMLEN